MRHCDRVNEANLMFVRVDEENNERGGHRYG